MNVILILGFFVLVFLIIYKGISLFGRAFATGFGKVLNRDNAYYS